MWVMIPSTVNNTTSLHLYSFFLPSSSRKEHWKLLSSLKTTVEGLVSTNNPNVWSRYGGLERLHKDMNNILSHGLKNEQVRRSDWHCCQFCDYLFFVQTVKTWLLTTAPADLQVKVLHLLNFDLWICVTGQWKSCCYWGVLYTIACLVEQHTIRQTAVLVCLVFVECRANMLN